MFRFPRNAPTRPIRRIGIFTGAIALTLAFGVQAASVAEASAAKHATMLVSTMKSALGSYLETAHGLTLYTFSLDTTNKSACVGVCAKQWPPLLVPKGAKLSKVVHGVKTSKLGEIKRSNGKFQLTYEGKPLYRFAGDKSPGQMTGQGYDNVWSVALVTPVTTTASPVAPVVTPTPQATSTGSTGSSGSHASSGSSGSSGSPTPSSPPTTQPPAPPTTTTPPPPTTTQPPPNLGGGGGGYGY